MAKSRVTSKGQVTIPRQVREKLGLRPGDEIEFVEEHGVFRIRRYFVESPFDKWVGYLKDLEGQDVDELIEEMRGR
jgi:AbrB family looped-hinge helix DNA binding protein